MTGGRAGEVLAPHLVPISDDPAQGQPPLARCVYTVPSRPYKEVHYAAWQKAWGCGFLHKEGVLFGLQGCLSAATLHHPLLLVSMAGACGQPEGSKWGPAHRTIHACSSGDVVRAPTI